MLVRELMERTGMSTFGIARAYIEESMTEMNIAQAPWQREISMSVLKGQRFYHMPGEAVKIMDIQVRNHMNGKGEFRSIPRLINEPMDKGSSYKNYSDLNRIQDFTAFNETDLYEQIPNPETDDGNVAQEYGYYIKGDKLAIVAKSLHQDPNADIMNDSNAYNKSDYSWRTPAVNNIGGIKVVFAYNPVYAFNKVALTGKSAPTTTSSRQHQTAHRIRGLFHATSNYQAISSAGNFINAEWVVLVEENFFNLATQKFEHQNVADFTDVDSTWASVYPVGSWIYLEDAGIFSGLWEITKLGGDDGATHAWQKGMLGIRRPIQFYDGQGPETLDVDMKGITDVDHPSTGGGIMPAWSMYNGRESFVISQISSLYTNKEDYRLPITELQAMAMMCYIRGQVALETGNMEMKMYYDKEFKRKLAQQETAYVSGPRMVSSGPFALKR